MSRSNDADRRRYRRLLRVFFPHDTRSHPSGPMEDAFVRLLEIERSKRGSLGVARVWIGAIGDGIRNGWVRRYLRRGGRVFPAARFSVLDLKLALRRLRKHWGLTLIGGLAIATGMSIGGFLFGAADVMRGQPLPLDEGDRVVALQRWDPRTRQRLETPAADMERWMATLTSLEDMGAFRSVTRNLILGDGPPDAITVAEMTASAWTLARVPPLLGRFFDESDEAPGAPPVLVIGADAWSGRFASDPGIVGRSVRVDGEEHVIVGVMPEGFGFPVFHDYWTPLRLGPDDRLVAGGGGAVFGRLAPGVSFARAQAELSAVGTVEAEIEGDREVESRLMRYTEALSGDDEAGLIFIMSSLLSGLLLLPVCANLGILIYARTVVRQEEFAARHALGAGRGRIVTQLFVEVLVLTAIAGVVALVAVRIALGMIGRLMEEQSQLPFWFDPMPSASNMLFVAGLALAAATVAGLAPALQATGRMMRHGVRASGAGSPMSLGWLWTGFVVVQVAFAMAAIPLASEIAWGVLRPGTLGPGFPAESYLTARLTLEDGGAEAVVPTDADTSPVETLVLRLAEEPEVGAVTFASWVPGSGPFRSFRIEPVDGVDPSEPLVGIGTRMAQVKSVDERFWNTFDMPVLAGRVLDRADAAARALVVVVDETFATTTFGDRSPIGHRFRYGNDSAVESEEWYEIVGVVSNRPENRDYAMVYHPAALAEAEAGWLVLRMDPARTGPFVARLRELASSVDPGFRIETSQTLDQLYRQQSVGNSLGALALGAGMLSVLLLSAGGIYALMSFTVNQRRPEIGVRSALGAPPRRLLTDVFRKALLQLGAGALAGVAVAGVLDIVIPEQLVRAAGGWEVPGVLPATAALMVLVGVAAAVGPARRGLGVDPTEAIRGGSGPTMGRR